MPGSASALAFEAGVEAAIDALADALERDMDVDAPFAAARAPCWRPGARVNFAGVMLARRLGNFPGAWGLGSRRDAT